MANLQETLLDIAKAIRTVIKAASAGSGKKVNVEIR